MVQKTFDDQSELGQVLKSWWLSLNENRGERAALRRARNEHQAALVPATALLIHQLRRTKVTQHPGWEARIPAIAGLCAHLDHHHQSAILHPKKSLPEMMAQGKNQGGPPRVSSLRFRRLLRTPRSELYGPMLRIIYLLDRKAPLYELAETLFWWGPNIQKEWAYTYFPKVTS